MKGLAVSYIIALIIGLVILAVGAYLIYKAMSEEALECNECKARFSQWCSTCYLSGWTSDTKLGSELSSCVSDCGFWSGASPDQICTDPAKNYCATVGVPL